MKKNIVNKWLIVGLVQCAVIALSGCDSGDIYPKENSGDGTDASVTASFSFSNSTAFPTNYKIVFGTFNEASPYPISSKVIAKPTGDEHVVVSLNNRSEEATYFALYLVQEYSNQKIYPFYTYPIEGTLPNDFELPLQPIDLAVFGRVQTQVLSQCIQCHGGSGFAAANLHLTPAKSYAALVDVTAVCNPDKKLVSAHNPEDSYLMDILKGEALQNKHATLSSLKEDDITLTQQWIRSGAKRE